MVDPILGLILALLQLVGGQVEFHHVEDFVEKDLYGEERSMPAALWCRGSDDRPMVIMTPRTSVRDLGEELLHAVDCLDNGELDGSPLGEREAEPCPRPEQSAYENAVLWAYYNGHPAELWADWGTCHPAEALRLTKRALAP